MYLAHSTIADNTGHALSGGIHNQAGSTLNLYFTIVANNKLEDAEASDLWGTIASVGHNLIGDSTGGAGYHSSDMLDVDPMLGPLADNGGPTQTYALLPRSPAIDADEILFPPLWDQRGEGFPSSCLASVRNSDNSSSNARTCRWFASASRLCSSTACCKRFCSASRSVFCALGAVVAAGFAASLIRSSLASARNSVSSSSKARTCRLFSSASRLWRSTAWRRRCCSVSSEASRLVFTELSVARSARAARTPRMILPSRNCSTSTGNILVCKKVPRLRCAISLTFSIG